MQLVARATKLYWRGFLNEQSRDGLPTVSKASRLTLSDCDALGASRDGLPTVVRRPALPSPAATHQVQAGTACLRK
jgi:hypothetical protein